MLACGIHQGVVGVPGRATSSPNEPWCLRPATDVVTTIPVLTLTPAPTRASLLGLRNSQRCKFRQNLARSCLQLRNIDLLLPAPFQGTVNLSKVTINRRGVLGDFVCQDFHCRSFQLPELKMGCCRRPGRKRSGSSIRVFPPFPSPEVKTAHLGDET